MKTKQRSIREQFILLFAGTAVFFGGAIIFFLIPAFHRINNNYAEFQKEKLEFERLFTEGSTKEALLGNIEDLAFPLRELQNGFIAPGNEVEFIRFLENLGSSHNIKQMIQLNEPGVHEKTDFFPFAVMSLKMQGTFEDFLSYLTELEQSPYYINITSLTIVSESGSADFSSVPEISIRGETASKTLSASIAGEVFWQHELET